MKTAIVIPARYGSTRFPGKPLAKINGHTMLSLVVDVANEAAGNFSDISVLVTTEDERIADHAREIGAECVLTSDDCATGSDRVLEAIKILGRKFETIINLQGDAPFTPPGAIEKMIAAFRKHTYEVVTPVHQLSWDNLDKLRDAKKTTPLSGTTAVVAKDGRALWFSKNIIPSIRDEKTLRAKSDKSPVYQHIGLYGYRMDALEDFCGLPQSPYEKLEGLEQLRFLENGIDVYTVLVDEIISSGIDSPEDLARAEARLK